MIVTRSELVDHLIISRCLIHAPVKYEHQQLSGKCDRDQQGGIKGSLRRPGSSRDYAMGPARLHRVAGL